MDEERLFTVSEANSLIPRLKVILQEVADEWTRIRDLQPEIQKAREKAQFDGHSPFGAEYVQSASHLMFLIQQIKEMGVVLKDIDKGLCDFPYMRQGRVVYLCWRLGEEAIEYWHDVESGFAGREPLDKTDL
jgi:hypothetical protein